MQLGNRLFHSYGTLCVIAGERYFFGKQNLVWFCVGVTAQMKALDEKKETTD